MELNIKDINTLLAIYAAVLSSILAILQIVQHRDKIKRNVRLIPTVNKPYDLLYIFISNIGFRPFTISEIKLVYGKSVESGCEIINLLENIKKKFEQSDYESISIPRNEIIRLVKEKDIKQNQFQRLWVVVNLSTFQRIISPVYIDSGIIKEDSYEPARPFIATDLFVGFTQMESTFNKVYFHK